MLTTTGFTVGSLNLLTSILSIAPGFLQFSKKQSSITPLNSAQISLFRPYTYFASSAYCQSSTTIDWSCGRGSFLSFPSEIGRVINYLYHVNNSTLR